MQYVIYCLKILKGYTSDIEHKNKYTFFSLETDSLASALMFLDISSNPALFCFLKVQNLEFYFIVYYEEFKGADHESAIYFCVSCIVSNL